MCLIGISMLAIAVNLPLIYLDSALVPFTIQKTKQNKKTSKGRLKVEAVNDFNPKVSFSDEKMRAER